MPKRFFYLCFFSFFCQTANILAATADNPLSPPSVQAVEEARHIISRMQDNPRGPYTQIRWYCNDGSVLPPKPYACVEHGGGRQHGEYSPDQQRLQALGWPTGTILAALSWDEFWDVDHNHRRLADLPLENFLIQTQDGWILKKAQKYRGRIQIEDEETAGRQLLLRVLEQNQWLEQNFLLVRELAQTLPHGAEPDLTRTIRRMAQDIAELEPSFEPLRVEIHTRTTERSAGHIRQWLDKYRSLADFQADIVAAAEGLSANLDALYGPAGRQQRLIRFQQALVRHPALQAINQLLTPPTDESLLNKTARLSRTLSGIRALVSTDITPTQRLLLIDGIKDLSLEMRVDVATLFDEQVLNRSQMLSLASYLSMAGFGEGLLSAGELRAITTAIDAVLTANTLSSDRYIALTHLLNLSSNWAIGSVRYAFAESLARYSALEPTASGYIDDVLRASSLLPLANLTKQLSFDAQQAYGVQKMLETNAVPSLLVLNPGIAVGTLRLVTEQELASNVPLRRDEIVVLPQTLSDLPPVAGVLTLGEGNLLSHVQLLARNFGIPNLALTPAALPELKQFAGQRVVLVAGGDGSVALWREDQLTADQKARLFQTQQQEKLVVPAVDLSHQDLIPLSQLRKGLSGVVVGPKAANLGELNAQFAGRVAPALGIPFGIFVDEVGRNAETDWQQLARLYQQHRDADIDDQQLTAGLQQLREAVSKTVISDALRQHLTAAMSEQFGEPGSFGVFIRSDTNVEDLPGFTGAGLSETIANVSGLEDIFTAIPRVWSSVLAPRAITWRSNLLQNPEQVYPSVLLMKSVPVEKSGVLITADLIWRKQGITVSTAWGVGGAVAGEAAESLLLLSDGSERLISEAKTPYQRALPLTGGVNWLPAPAGPVLTDDEKAQLRVLVEDVKHRMSPVLDVDGKAMPWDIEFGFVEGELTLFQIRPLVERGVVRADRVLRYLLPPTSRDVPTLDLTETPVWN